jgi:hypothetical protein
VLSSGLEESCQPRCPPGLLAAGASQQRQQRQQQQQQQQQQHGPGRSTCTAPRLNTMAAFSKCREAWSAFF